MRHTRPLAAILLSGILAAGCTDGASRPSISPSADCPSPIPEQAAEAPVGEVRPDHGAGEIPDVEVRLVRGKALELATDGIAVRAPGESLLHGGTYSATTLQEEDLPPLGEGMVNVTGGVGAAYRLLPSGEHFRPAAELRVRYDASKLPRGYTPDDIYTSYYDEQEGAWRRLERVGVDTALSEVVSLTTHFTDFVNEVLKVPEMPETQAFVPTAVSSVEAASPMDGQTLVQAPAANGGGTAEVTYPIALPAGRRGMQPQLVLTYSSGGGDGWLGAGWDLPVPSITVETRWGVPRYDPDHESEVYLLGGEQLVARDADGDYLEMPHRTNVRHARLADGTRFFPRVDDAHDSIVRHGTGPRDYWWSVTHSNGVTDYYGRLAGSGTGTSAGTVDRAGGTLASPGGDIARWVLTESRDTYGNYVTYRYDTVCRPGVGTAPGRAIYLSRIRYTGNGSDSGAYEVYFKRKPRPDISISCNYGFKEVSSELLESIVVTLNGEVLTMYYLDTRDEGGRSLYKTRLRSVTRIDTVLADPGLAAPGVNWDNFRNSIGATVVDSSRPYLSTKYPYAGATTLFDYYDAPCADSLFADPVTAVGLADASGDIDARGLPGATTPPTALGGTQSRGWDLGGTVGAGAGPVVMLTTASLGGSYSYSESESTGLMTLIDLDGDGLADKVYKKSDGVFCQLQLPPPDGAFSLAYGAEFPLAGVDDFLVEESHTNSWGGQFSLGYSLSAGWPTTTSTTSVYFADVNADGLPDLVNDGVVLFNSLDASGKPAFGTVAPTAVPDGDGGTIPATVVTTSATGACHPVVIDGEVDPGIACTRQVKLYGHYTEAEYNAQRDQLLRDFPDGIWVYDDLFPDHPYAFYDQLWECHADPDPDFEAVKVWMAPKSGTITIYDTARLLYDPRIEGLRHADGVTCAIQVHRSPVFGSDGRFHSAGTVDQLPPVTIGREDFGPKARTYTVSNVKAGDLVLFRLVSGSSHDCDNVDWRHTIVYSGNASSDCYGRPGNRFSSREDFVVAGRTYFQAVEDGGVAIDSIILPQHLASTVHVAVTRYHGSTPSTLFSANVAPGAPIPSTITAPVSKGDSIIIAVSRAGSAPVHWGSVVCAPRIAYTYTPHDEGGNLLPSSVTACYYPPARMSIYYSGIYSTYCNPMLQRLFGPMYRGWGQFAYNHADGQSQLDLTSLVLPGILADAATGNSSTMAQDTAGLHDLADGLGHEPERSAMEAALASVGIDLGGTSSRWVEMHPDSRRQQWYGYGQTTHLSRTGAGNTRQRDLFASDSVADLAPADSPVPLPPSGGLAQTIRKTSTSQTISLSQALSLPVVSVGASYSSGTNSVETDYLDLNGDRYPDFVGPGRVQYSQPWGGIGSMQSLPLHINGTSVSQVSTSGITFGASCPVPQRSPSASPRNARVSLRGDGNASVSGNSSSSSSSEAWIDVNGDGLPDRVHYGNGQSSVALNIGYSFLPYEPWTGLSAPARSDASRSVSISGGMAVNIGQASISAGVAGGLTRSTTTLMLCDLNGDGLPDILAPGGVRYGRGAGRYTETVPAAIGCLGLSRSSNTAATAGATYGATFWSVLKVTAGLSATPITRSASSDSLQIVDVNGDGLPDIASSDAEGTLTVRLNRTGPANLLRQVTNFTGSGFSIAYSLTPASREQPQRQWVMSSVTAFDPYTPAGVDSATTRFSYGTARYDRHERTSFGFDTVTTTQYRGGDRYRITREAFENTLYARRGRKTYDILLDGDGNPYVEHFYSARLRDSESDDGDTLCPTHVCTSGEAVQTNYYEGHATVRLTTAERFEYDRHHNVVAYASLGDVARTGDELYAELDYLSGAPSNLVSLRREARVYASDRTTLMRRSSFEYDGGTPSRGSLTSLVCHNGATPSTYSFSYDPAYGLMTSAVLPANHRGQAVEYQYTYDPTLHTYPATVSKPAFGLSTSTAYDCRYGLPASVTDPAGETVRYRYDYAGRLTAVSSPSATGVSLRRHYYPRNYLHTTSQAPPWSRFGTPNCYAPAGHTANPQYPFAVSTRFSDDGADSVRSATILDAAGLTAQTKSEADAEGGAWIVASGLPDTAGPAYDEWGRLLARHDPVLQTLSDNLFGVLCRDGAPLRHEYAYDVLDRTTSATAHLGSSILVESTAYDIDNALSFATFLTAVTDPAGGTSTSRADALGRTVESTDPLLASTSFLYDALGQLLASTDPDGFTTGYEYDMLGRLTARHHPDAGTIDYAYDPAGNTVGQHFAGGDIVSTTFDYDRPVRKHFSRLAQNDVSYKYDAAGRLESVSDGSGSQSFSYDPLGNVSHTVRTLAVPDDRDLYTFETDFLYDTWGRTLAIGYPDGERAEYGYDRGWNLHSVTTTKNGSASTLLRSVCYDRFGSRTSATYGNGVTATYAYDDLRRLVSLRSSTTAYGATTLLQDVGYSFDPLGNIVRAEDNAPRIATPGIGGTYSNSYSYDDASRLVTASGSHAADFDMGDLRNAYTPAGRLAGRYQSATGLDLVFGYCQSSPHAPRRIFNAEDGLVTDLRWNADGNLVQTASFHAAETGTLYGLRGLFWAPENRLHTVVDDRYYSYYAYDHAGERVLKIAGSSNIVDENAEGATSYASLDGITLYASPFLVATRHGYTKHYYAGSERLAARLGHGGISGILSVSDEEAPRKAADLFDECVEEVNGRVWHSLDEAGCAYGPLSDRSELRAEGKLTPLFAEAKPMIDHGAFSHAMRDAQYDDGHPEDETYFYHGDHLGSASWITDHHGEPVQHLVYLPFGEELANERMSGYSERFTFTGKELDEETGYGYFGARYMDHELMTGWLSVDPMADKYPSISPYAYCNWNPVKLVDPDGRDINPVYGSDGSFRGCTKEGFTGEIIIYDGKENFSNLSKEELYRKDDDAMPYSLANTTMKDDAKSKMYTHIVSQYEGESVLGMIFSMDDVHDGKIKFDKTKPGNWCTTYETISGLGDGSDIYATDHYLQTYEATVENILSSLIFHEWFSHKIQGCGDKTGNHQQAYQNVMDGALWGSTTDNYQNFIQKKFIDYDGR